MTWERIGWAGLLVLMSAAACGGDRSTGDPGLSSAAGAGGTSGHASLGAEPELFAVTLNVPGYPH